MPTNNEDEDVDDDPIVDVASFQDASDRTHNTNFAHEYIPHGMYVHSNNPPCREDANGGDYSECRELRIDLPLGAQIVDVRLIARLLKRHGGQWMVVPAGKDLAWARFNRSKITTTDNNTSVTAVFKNWSHVHTREARLEVDWRLPR